MMMRWMRVTEGARRARPQTTIVPAPFRTFPTRLARENGFPPRPGDGIARQKGGVAGAAQQQHGASTEEFAGGAGSAAE